MGQFNCVHLDHVSVAKQTVRGRVLWVEMRLLYSLAINDFSTRLRILPSSLDTTELFGKMWEHDMDSRIFCSTYSLNEGPKQFLIWKMQIGKGLH